MAGVTALLVLLVVAVPAYATEYTVGDTQGWTSSVDYGTWVSDKTFKVGDSISFQYGLLHTVDEVSESDYKSCSSSNSIQSFNDQNTKITLSKSGSRYFICGTPGHCSGGMKLAVTVSDSTSPSPSTSTPSTPEGSTPSSSTPSTPSSSGQPASKTPSTSTTTKINGATGGGFSRGDALLIGMLLVLGRALMG